MARPSLYIVCSVLLCGLALGLAKDIPPTIIIPVPPTTNGTTTEATTTTSSTTTTEMPTTTTTTEVPTTTPEPKTTTPAPSPTPAPAPTPLPPADEGKWAYPQGENVTCIMLQFAARLNVSYTMTAGNDTKMGHALLNVPANASVIDGSCNNLTQYITLSWPQDTKLNNVTLQFQMNTTTKSYYLSYFNVTVTPDEHFPNASSKEPLSFWRHLADEWIIPETLSYSCPTGEERLEASAAASADADVTLSKIRLQAFRTQAGNAFSAARECGGSVPDAVPIVVGCVLASLVLVVLVAYLLARRRARGYLSM